MKYISKYIASLGFLIVSSIVISLPSFHASAAGLQDYLQDTPTVVPTETSRGNLPEAAELAEQTTPTIIPSPSVVSDADTATTTVTTSAAAPAATSPATIIEKTNLTNAVNSPLSYIIELVVAGIVAAALIISVLVLFLGRWTANKEKRIIKEIRIEAEIEKDNLISAASSVREKEKETMELVTDMKKKANLLNEKVETVGKKNAQVIAASEGIIKQEKELKDVANVVSTRMESIQDYWDDQLNETVSIIGKVQSGLDDNLSRVDKDILGLQQHKLVADELLQDFLSKHQAQEGIVNNNTKLSDKISKNLQKTFEESSALLTLLKKQKSIAEKSLKGFEKELTAYEEQAYEQFDTTFQVADLARQELNANIDESRKHIETMRRHEEQSHNINTQTQKNLELLDYSKIKKLSVTLESTHDMFSDIRHKIDETKSMLDELKDIQTDIESKPTSVIPAQFSPPVQNIIKTENEPQELIPSVKAKNPTLKKTTQVKKKTKKVVSKKKVAKATKSASTTKSTTAKKKTKDEVAKARKDSAHKEELKQEEQLDRKLQPSVAFDTEYKMASGDFTPLSFFKNMKGTTPK